MKKQIAFICVIVSVHLWIFLASDSARGVNGLNYDWGTQLAKVKTTLPADKDQIQFSPSEKPKYKNKILSYITAIDAKLLEKIIIIRIKSAPVVDYLFVNNKLYTIMENWGNIDQKTEKDIQVKLTGLYGEPLVQRDKNFYIYSFNNDKTKVLLYLMKNADGKSKCKVYYYTKQLFRMLIAE